MKHAFRATAVALVLVGATAAARAYQQASLKVGFVDGNVLLAQAPGKVQAEAMFAKERAAFEAEVAKMSDTLKAMQKRYQDEEATLSPAKRTERQKEMNDRLDLYTRRQDSLSQLAARRQAELIQPVIELVTKVIQDIRAEDGYTMIFNLAADGQPIVAYDKNLDITDRVLAKVKVQPAPKLPEPAGKPAAKIPPAGKIPPTPER